MSKAQVIIELDEMPATCVDCQFFSLESGPKCYLISEKELGWDSDKRSDACPLRETYPCLNEGHHAGTSSAVKKLRQERRAKLVHQAREIVKANEQNVDLAEARHGRGSIPLEAFEKLNLATIALRDAIVMGKIEELFDGAPNAILELADGTKALARVPSNAIEMHEFSRAIRPPFVQKEPTGTTPDLRTIKLRTYRLDNRIFFSRLDTLAVFKEVINADT